MSDRKQWWIDRAGEAVGIVAIAYVAYLLIRHVF